jgi:hypothetical protein
MCIRKRQAARQVFVELSSPDVSVVAANKMKLGKDRSPGLILIFRFSGFPSDALADTALDDPPSTDFAGVATTGLGLFGLSPQSSTGLEKQ